MKSTMTSDLADLSSLLKFATWVSAFVMITLALSSLIGIIAYFQDGPFEVMLIFLPL